MFAISKTAQDESPFGRFIAQYAIPSKKRAQFMANEEAKLNSMDNPSSTINTGRLAKYNTPNQKKKPSTKLAVSDSSTLKPIFAPLSKEQSSQMDIGDVSHLCIRSMPVANFTSFSGGSWQVPIIKLSVAQEYYSQSVFGDMLNRFDPARDASLNKAISRLTREYEFKYGEEWTQLCLSSKNGGFLTPPTRPSFIATPPLYSHSSFRKNRQIFPESSAAAASSSQGFVPMDEHSMQSAPGEIGTHNNYRNLSLHSSTRSELCSSNDGISLAHDDVKLSLSASSTVLPPPILAPQALPSFLSTNQIGESKVHKMFWDIDFLSVSPVITADDEAYVGFIGRFAETIARTFYSSLEIEQWKAKTGLTIVSRTQPRRIHITRQDFEEDWQEYLLRLGGIDVRANKLRLNQEILENQRRCLMVNNEAQKKAAKKLKQKKKKQNQKKTDDASSLSSFFVTTLSDEELFDDSDGSDNLSDTDDDNTMDETFLQDSSSVVESLVDGMGRVIDSNQLKPSDVRTSSRVRVLHSAAYDDEFKSIEDKHNKSAVMSKIVGAAGKFFAESARVQACLEEQKILYPNRNVEENPIVYKVGITINMPNIDLNSFRAQIMRDHFVVKLTQVILDRPDLLTNTSFLMYQDKPATFKERTVSAVLSHIARRADPLPYKDNGCCKRPIYSRKEGDCLHCKFGVLPYQNKSTMNADVGEFRAPNPKKRSHDQISSLRVDNIVTNPNCGICRGYNKADEGPDAVSHIVFVFAGGGKSYSKFKPFWDPDLVVENTQLAATLRSKPVEISFERPHRHGRNEKQIISYKIDSLPSAHRRFFEHIVGPENTKNYIREFVRLCSIQKKVDISHTLPDRMGEHLTEGFTLPPCWCHIYNPSNLKHPPPYIGHGKKTKDAIPHRIIMKSGDGTGNETNIFGLAYRSASTKAAISNHSTGHIPIKNIALLTGQNSSSSSADEMNGIDENASTTSSVEHLLRRGLHFMQVDSEQFSQYDTHRFATSSEQSEISCYHIHKSLKDMLGSKLSHTATTEFGQSYELPQEELRLNYKLRNTDKVLYNLELQSKVHKLIQSLDEKWQNLSFEPIQWEDSIMPLQASMERGRCNGTPLYYTEEEKAALLWDGGVYIVKTSGPGSHDCPIAKRKHKSSKIAFRITRTKIILTCSSHSTANCFAKFGPQIWVTPKELREPLFPCPKTRLLNQLTDDKD